MNTSPIVMITGGIGALLIYSAIRGYNPIDVLKSGLGGPAPTPMLATDSPTGPMTPTGPGSGGEGSSGGGFGGGGGGSFSSSAYTNAYPPQGASV